MSVSAAPGAPPYPGPDTNRQAELIAIWGSFSLAMVIIIAVRFWARIKIHGLGLDDWFMMLTVLLFLASAGLIIYYTAIGGTRHIYYLFLEGSSTRVVEFFWISQPTAIWALFTGKAAVAFLVLRLIGPNAKIRRIVLYVIIAATLIVNSISVIITLTQCQPVQGLWDKSIQANCWNPNVQLDWNYFGGAVNVAADVFLAIMPATFIMQLNMSISNKIKLSILLGLGLIAAGFAAVKTYMLGQLTARSDITFDTFDVFVWAGAELVVIVLCGSAPTIKPLYDHYFKGKSFESWKVHESSKSDNSSWWNKRPSKHFNTWNRSHGQSDSETLYSTNSDGHVPLAPVGNGILVTSDFDVHSDSPEPPAKVQAGRPPHVAAERPPQINSIHLPSTKLEV